MQVAGLVGDGGDVSLVAYGELGESCAVGGSAERFFGQDFVCNLAGSVELGYLVVFLGHPEAAVGVGIDLGSTTAVAAVCICFAFSVFQRYGVHIVVAAAVFDFEVYDFVGAVFGEPYSAVVERSAESYGSTGDDACAVFLDEYARCGCIVVPNVYAEVLGGCYDVGGDEFAVGYGETAEFAESTSEVGHGERAFVLAVLGVDDVHCDITPVFAVEYIKLVTNQSNVTVG